MTDEQRKDITSRQDRQIALLEKLLAIKPTEKQLCPKCYGEGQVDSVGTSSNPEKFPEKILCAAIYYNDGKGHQEQPDNIGIGFVIAGRRHSDCYGTAVALLGKGALEALETKRMVIHGVKGHDAQGFITSHNRYVGRAEAFQIAKKQGQIVIGGKSIDPDRQILISENLY